MASQNIRLEELGILPPVHPGIDRASIGFMKRCRRAGEKTRPLQTEDEQLMQDYFLRLPRSHATSSERVFAQSPYWVGKAFRNRCRSSSARAR
jgi:hypothetical protein